MIRLSMALTAIPPTIAAWQIAPNRAAFDCDRVQK
jgi:hypothetical protein